MQIQSEKWAAIRLIAFDFDGVFTDNTVWIDQNGVESVRCWRGDGIGLKKLRSRKIKAVVISTEKNPVVSIRMKKLNLPCYQGVADKYQVLDELRRSADIEWNQVAFMGNDINDSSCLRVAGLSIVVNDAHPQVKEIADYITRSPGGFGAVREVCDIFEEINHA